MHRAARRPSRRLVVGSLLVALGMVATACGGSPGRRTADGRLRVVASFYPLAWMAEQVGGDHVQVTSLTKPGAEPHDLELTPREVASVQDAAAVVYLSGFQPSVDDAVGEASGTVFDARRAAHLDLTYTPIEGGETRGGEAGTTDPHFWLDPSRLASVARAFTRTLGAEDPGHAADYRHNLRRLVRRLATLDGDYRAGLVDCANRDLVTSHNAFGYLGRRYDLRQVPITGLTPEDEPSPSDLAAVTRFVERHDVRTIYFETLVSPAVAETVASETGARTAVLDPIEGLNDTSQGDDYLQVMRANLRNLQRGQPCRGA